ncbi:MAG: 2-oxoglutarate dehydrogenase complex dihydrolipoyllysine-residue succinyltransferase [Gammaproteobacteria bacterium]
MKVSVTVPELAESITEAVVGEWLKQPGDTVEEGEQIVDIETDKVILEITAPQSGELASINKQKNENVTSNEVLATINTNKRAAPSRASNINTNVAQLDVASKSEKFKEQLQQPAKTSPAVRKLAVENNVDIKNIHGSGKDGRITKQDIEDYIKSEGPPSASELDSATEILEAPQIPESGSGASDREDQRIPMTSLRKNIAKRLVKSQHESAMLTTFNEVNMQNIMDLRSRYKESFEEAHSVKLGFMSFFVKAAIEALKEFPVLNASVEDEDIIYHNYFDIGIAVSTQKGLIVPVIRNADSLSFAGIEIAINDFGTRARENKITIEELTGGTFTITNGGVFGSMLSTPIINPPQSAILGMHSIQARPIAQNGEIVIAPMMYLALTYDHRIIDGKEAVQFLVLVKNILEDPNRLLLQV